MDRGIYQLAIIFGQSNCTSTLLRELGHIKKHNFRTFDHVKHFKENFPVVLKIVEEREHSIIDGKIQHYSDGIAKQEKTLLGSPSFFTKIGCKVKRWHATRRVNHFTTHRDHIVRKKTLHVHRWKAFIDGNMETYTGAIGEEMVIDELSKLPDDFTVINDVQLILNRSVYWKKHGEYVRSAQIDHVVIGPPGVFIIETKNWAQWTLDHASFSPHKQVDRASLVLWLLSKHVLRKNYKTYNIVATTKDLRRNQYPFVYQMPAWRLVRFILSKPSTLKENETRKILHWFNYFLH